MSYLLIESILPLYEMILSLYPWPRRDYKKSLKLRKPRDLWVNKVVPFFIFIPLIDFHTPRAQPTFLQFWPKVMTLLRAWFQYLRWHESIRPYKFASKAGNKLREDSSKVGKKKIENLNNKSHHACLLGQLVSSKVFVAHPVKSWKLLLIFPCMHFYFQSYQWLWHVL